MIESNAQMQKTASKPAVDPSSSLAGHRVVSRDEWLKERTALVAKERAAMKAHDELSAQRRALPWVKIEKNYVFDSPTGKVTLADLFDGRSQLFIKHFMMGPGQTNQCVGCALEVDHLEGLLPHLQNHDVSYVAVARAPIDEIEAYRKRMNWKFPWVSSYGSDFNFDFNVSFTPEELKSGKAFYNFREMDPGIEDLSGDSVFFKDAAGQIFHTYSVFARGAEQFLGIYAFFDLMPKGRNENDKHTLADWARPHDMYGQGGMVEPTGRYHASSCGCSAHK
jgi:predicted dithiol-disulfide oxidoreductase (DUF899 family)